MSPILVNLIGLGLVLLSALLMVILRATNQKQPLRGLRSIPAFDHIREGIGQAVEEGSRLHISLGNASPNSQQAASALVGLSTLERITQLSAASDRPPIATSGDGGLAILSQGNPHGVLTSGDSAGAREPARGRLSGPTPFSYVAGTLPVLLDEEISTNLFLGNFGPEIALLADTAEEENTFTLAGSDSLPAQAALYATAREPLIGEELFASGAYLQSNPMHPASLRVQDVLRVLIILGILVGVMLNFLNISL